MRAVIVGAGLMGRHHAHAVRKAGANIVAIVDPNQGAASTLARALGAPLTVSDLGIALEKVNPNVVHICTPAISHEHLASQTAGAGCHALIEKPLASTAARTRSILNDFASAGRKVCPTHQYAFQRSVRVAARSMAQLGTIRRISIDVCSAGGAYDGADLDSLVADILPHPLSIIQKLSPDTSITGLKWHCLRVCAGEWLITAPIFGGSLSINLSMNGRPTRFLTQVFGDRGALELDNFHDFCVRLSGKVSKSRKISAPFVRHGLGLASATANLLRRASRGESAYPGLQQLVSDFYAGLNNTEIVVPITDEETIAVAEARDEIIFAARQ